MVPEAALESRKPTLRSRIVRVQVYKERWLLISNV
jgi:hypothetical protein